MPVDVRCAPDGDGYRCAVEVSDPAGTSRHAVAVSGKDFKRWGRGRSVEELVRDSFAFLLQREPKESILKAFELAVIGHYFPDYDGA